MCVRVCVCKGVHACDVPITSITTPKIHKSEPQCLSDSNMLTNIIMFITISGIPMQQAEQPEIECLMCYGVALITRLLEIIGLFCRIWSL